MNIEIGLRGDAKLSVTAADTAVALGSGSVDVLGTPRLIALSEEAAVNALSNVLPSGSTTVGMRIQFDHLQPTPVGVEVTAEAVLERIEGRRLVFNVTATDPGGLVGAGRITRVIVEVDRFMSKCCSG